MTTLVKLTEAVRAAILAELAPVRFEAACVVADDPGEVVRHATPMTEAARARVREQQIARLRRDDAAVRARETRIAIERGRVRAWRRA